MNDKTKPQEKRGGWLSRFAPGVRKIVSRRDTPDNLWVKDPDTGDMLYRSELESALADYQSRQRRFGKTGEQVVSPT